VSEQSQLVLMAEYNRLMNQRIIKASLTLSDASLNEDKGAFFKSVLATLNHIMIGDILWMKRFSEFSSNVSSLMPLSAIEKPESLDQILFSDLKTFEQERVRLDNVIINWCHELTNEDLDKPLAYTNFKREKHNKRLGDVVLHVFLHQVHHRGQVTTLLSQEGIDFGETDLPEIVPEMTC